MSIEHVDFAAEARDRIEKIRRTVVWDPEEARDAASREIEYGPDVHEEEH